MVKSTVKVIAIALSLLSIIGIKGEALVKSPPNVQLIGEAEGLVHIPNDDIFLFSENMLPGDSIIRTLEIKNNYSENYELFMRAERVSPREEFDLLEVLTLKIIYKNKVIYDGPLEGRDGLSKNISLGTFKPGDEEFLLAEVNLDGPSIGNEYKNKFAQVDWIFTATRDTEGGGGEELPHTGDKGILGYGILAGVAVIFLLLIKGTDKKS